MDRQRWAKPGERHQHHRDERSAFHVACTSRRTPWQAPRHPFVRLLRGACLVRGGVGRRGQRPWARGGRRGGLHQHLHRRLLPLPLRLHRLRLQHQ